MDVEDFLLLRILFNPLLKDLSEIFGVFWYVKMKICIMKNHKNK